MGDFLRTTRECTLDSLSPLLAAAIRDHIQKYKLGDAEAEAMICVKTLSTQKKKGAFAAQPEVVQVGILLTSRWLIWGSGKENEPPDVLSSRLRDLRVQDYETSEFNKMVPDTGLTLSHVHKDTGELGGRFIGLGPEPAAQKFRALLMQAIAKAG